MRVEVKTVPFWMIKACEFEPEPHTVILNKDKTGSVWWTLVNEEDDILCVICIVERKNEVHFARTFTPQKHRKKGYCTFLLDVLARKVYANKKLTAHCLKASVNCYKNAGFELVKVKDFKHGKQYFMMRTGDGK